MKKFLLLVFFILNLSASIYSQTISSYEIIGSKKTNPEFFDQYLQPCIGKDSSQIDLNEIETSIRSTGIFSDINIFLEEKENTDELILKVSLKEKITFLPLPFAYYSSSGWGAGAFVLDLNAFGKGNMIATGAMYTSSTYFGMFAFAKPASANKNGFSTFIGGGKYKNSHQDLDGNITEEFSNLGFSANFSLSQNIKKWFSISESLAWNYNYFFEDFYDNFHVIKANTNLNFGRSNWNGFFMLQNKARISGGVGFSTSDNFFENLQFTSSLQTKFFTDRIRFSFDTEISCQHNDCPLLIQKASETNAKILPENFTSAFIADSTLTLEAALYKNKFLTLTALTSYLGVFLQDTDNSLTFCHGPSLGTFVYLEKIALPALGIIYNYNVSKDLHHFSVSLGISF